jgi:hypothetical protein
MEENHDLSAILATNGLGKYEEVLKENGFDDFETVTAIIEADMIELGFTLGDRRKLQRVIAKATRPSPGPSTVASTTSLVKRKYRRHPQADPNAPVRPKTAYVLFGETVRSDSSLRSMSFPDVAKETGKRWQSLSFGQRSDEWEKPAAERLVEFKSDLKVYEGTQEYREHQHYLGVFRETQIRSEAPSITNKTPRLFQRLKPDEGAAAFSIEDDDQDVFESDDMSAISPEFEPPHDQNIPPLQVGMEEVANIYSSLGVASRFNRTKPYPAEYYTAAAVQAFLHNTGSLLYLWSEDEAAGLLRSVYHSNHGPANGEAVEVFAMSAIGSYCDGDAKSSVYQQTFMDSFMYLLQSRTEVDKVRDMRLLACLAICRFTNSVVGVAYNSCVRRISSKIPP